MGELRYNISLIISNLLFGISFSVYVSLLRGALNFDQLFALQLLFATITFTPIAIARPNFFKITLNDFGSIFIVALLVIFGWRYLLIAGASYTNPIDASTITTIGPIFTLIASIIIHSHKVILGEKIGIFIALAGVITILIDRGELLVGEGGEGYGNTLVLCAVVAIAVNTLLISPVLHRHGAVVIMGWYYIIGTFIALPLLIREIPTLSLLYLSPAELAELGFILIFGSSLPMYLLYTGSDHLTAIHTAIYRYIQPIVATILAVVRGQAIIDRTNIVGAALIFLGMLCVIVATLRKRVTRV